MYFCNLTKLNRFVLYPLNYFFLAKFFFSNTKGLLVQPVLFLVYNLEHSLELEVGGNEF